jgi:hypothetical protein
MSIVKLNNRGVRSATAFGSISALGEMRFIKKLTASSSATISFVHGSSDVVLDNTYKEYLFTFNNIHSSGNNTDAKFSFNGSIDAGSNYNVAKTTTVFGTYLGEDGSDAELAYKAGDDLAQGTGFQNLTNNGNNDNDGNLGGYLRLFNPSSTTFVKHFTASISSMHAQPAAISFHIAGYFNTTSDIDAVQFKMNSGNIDAGDICLYGIN